MSRLGAILKGRWLVPDFLSRDESYLYRTVWRGAHHRALELSPESYADAPCGSDCGRKLCHCEVFPGKCPYEPCHQRSSCGPFPPEYIYCPEADLPFETLWQERYDMIFFTGSPAAGRIVMKAASEHLTPVILELGGKSPCLVDASANIDLAARRIVWGKFMNAGQTCIAVDYVVVQESVKDALLAAMTKEIGKRYPHAEKSDAYPSIINQRHYDRLIGLMKTESSLIGGAVNAEKRRIAPTLMPEADFDHPIMEDEIFGPLLPIIAVKDMQNAVAHIKTLPNPLACYVFTENKAVAEAVIANLSFGGGCINDTLLHVTNPNLPFGGVGNSGMGSYHGKASFDAFSHKKSIVKNTTRFDISLRYAPFTERKVKWLKRFF